LGARHLINYRQYPEWANRVLELTNGKGVDLVIEVVGADTIKQSLAATRHGGHIVLVGILSTNPNRPVDIMPDVLYGAKTLEGQLGVASRDLATEMVKFMEEHQIHPQIGRVHKFENAREAMDEVASPTVAGKIVIEV
jgi:NADPH:quinone reductase-like Zn-dependent oxidoreductase